ncbi:serine carboxypeptidase-like 50 [Wolffia australiana]
MENPSPLHVFLVFFFTLSYQTAAAPPASSPPFPDDALPTLSGYLPISATSAMYFTYYEAHQATSPLSLTPLLVWLQGGPGCSSMIGNFFELGPWLVTNSSSGHPSFSPNPFSWNRLFGLLFLDNPVGVGFSVAGNVEDVPSNQTAVSEQLWIALQRFFSLNPSFRARPLYLTGESYAGKYVPSAGYYISQKNAKAGRRINLAGVAIGNGLTHPATQVKTHADSAFFTGLINELQRTHLEKLQEEAARLAATKDWGRATDARNRALEYLNNSTGLATLFDLRRKKPYETELLAKFLAAAPVKAALGAKEGIEWEECSRLVAKALHEDVMKSAKPAVEGLLRGGEVKMLLYQGMFDLRDGVLSTERWLKETRWEGLERFSAAERKVWRLASGDLAGYVQAYGKLSHVVVAGAGHLVPADQGWAAQVMIEDWVMDRGVFGGGGGVSLA